jgi:hypothetical protein
LFAATASGSSRLATASHIWNLQHRHVPWKCSLTSSSCPLQYIVESSSYETDIPLNLNHKNMFQMAP